MFVNLIFDPKIINYILITLYGANIIRWGVAGSYGDAMYWSGALWITLAVTFGYTR